MIDTFEISLESAYSIVDLLSMELEKEIKFVSRNACKISNPLGQPGVRAINITRQKNSNMYSIAVEINPTELLKEAPSIELFDCSQENVEALQRTLNEVLESIHPYFSLTRWRWRLTRVDYARQFYTPDVELYTILESKGPVPYRYKGLQKSGSTYNECKSSRINAYNKEDQLSKTNSPAFLKEQAVDLYRFEYQCLDPTYLLKKYNVDRSAWLGLFREDIAIAVLKAHHKRHIKVGDYYTYGEAAKRIMKLNGKQQRIKEQAIEVLEFIGDAGSIPNALQAIQNDATDVPERFKSSQGERSYELLKDRFNEFIREHLCKEGINPVLLPNDYGITMLPNTSTRLFTIA
ncbi:hypothetical protein MHZ92_18375 [Sporosarcina sp. ACRSL]|uniref:hypothetical protein n=1 Tax=Sporosarcina sp. ACRSL TaxID=2918215 RepID=UPI001EF55D6A|nr:hypothetical protein [Sporosarcina sp. ACRSL]MCG7346082.1 hypothetical protein [Sporosarcina sp. ACRSL]